jgi:hypothetical protein
MPVRRREHAVDFVREITNHKHRSWVRADDQGTSSWGLECITCGSRFLIALEAFRYQGGDRYSKALRDCAVDPQKDLLETILGFTCIACNTTEGVRLEPSRTQYDTSYPRTRFERILDPEPENPNIDIPLCRSCAEDHHEYWNQMWQMVRSNQM